MISPEEAFLIFDKWSSEKATLDVSGKLIGWSFEARCLCSVFPDGMIRATSLEGRAIFEFNFGIKDTGFEYAEPITRDIPGIVVSGLSVALPLRVSLDAISDPLGVPPREHLFFFELAVGRNI